jgi:plasmid maintenance system killer protein
VDVRFRTARLRTCYKQHQEGVRDWGSKVARRFVQRVNLLYAAETKSDSRTMKALRFHKLGGKREGQCGIDLDRRMRLIVTFPSPGIVQVEKVSKHYGD